MENVIRQAMKVMATRGMAKGVSEDSRGRVCIGGAISVAMTGNHLKAWLTDPFVQAMTIVGNVSAEQYPERSCENAWGYQTSNPVLQAQYFNNHTQTTLEDVLRLMDKAAVRLDEAV